MLLIPSEEEIKDWIFEDTRLEEFLKKNPPCSVDHRN